MTPIPSRGLYVRCHGPRRIRERRPRVLCGRPRPFCASGVLWCAAVPSCLLIIIYTVCCLGETNTYLHKVDREPKKIPLKNCVLKIILIIIYYIITSYCFASKNKDNGWADTSLTSLMGCTLQPHYEVKQWSGKKPLTKTEIILKSTWNMDLQQVSMKNLILRKYVAFNY